ncbi:LAFA_0D08614g1_1 [Lachancea sp. 'fantastica']|nr:LAFA_0D08614g1_1 [Lachancea sp. 'fantastica']
MRSTDENFKELCYWCRIGDVENVDRLISKGVNLNDIDDFNNSPLFLASLCGHEDLVNLLLKRGAICDRDRHEGARCIYGALTDSIRNILLKYDISKAVDLKQPFAAHLSSQLTDRSIDSHDILLQDRAGHKVKLHRFLLLARSSYFADQLQSMGQDNAVLNLPKDVPDISLDIISKYLYLVPLLHGISRQESLAIGSFCKVLGFYRLAEFLEKVSSLHDQVDISRLMTEYQHHFTEEARKQMQLFATTIVQEKRHVNVTDGIASDILSSMKLGPTMPDVFLFVRQKQNSEQGFLYPCHRSILMRSEYFRVMFTSSFDETTIYRQTQEGIVDRTVIFPVVSFPICDFETAELILSYLYYDHTEIPWQIAINVLRAADALLIERLKTMAAVAITQSPEFLQMHTVFEVLDVAWEFRVERLEHHVAKTIASDISNYVAQPLLREAILRSSAMLQKREETDTIELVDDIRYYLLKKYNIDVEDLDDMGWDDSGEDKSLIRKEISMYRSDFQVLEDLLLDMNVNV